ncbi:MAG: HAMP domain-containing sensor histidine kinase [Acidimicrobiia bacterium]|nr:HAMP domain-containing sensor histidine kinase [Acidimicrobiia bacterium]
MRLLIPLAAIMVALVLLITEATMQPTSADRALLYGIFAGAAVLTLLVGWRLPAMTRKFHTLRTTLQIVGLAAVVIAAAAVSVSAITMFLSTHDLRLVLVALLLGVGLGVALAVTVTRPLAADLADLARAAGRVGAGDLSARTSIERADEVGEVARAMDMMIDQLGEARRMQERSDEVRREFLAALGHDLRTPLTSMRAAVEALQDGLAPDPDRYLNSVAKDIENLSVLIDDLFELATLEAGERPMDKIEVDLAALADEVAHAMVPLTEPRSISVQIEGSAIVSASELGMMRVMRNLIENAVQHSPSGGTVTIEVSENQAHATVTVGDDGPGFPVDFKDRAFESFTRADSARRRGGAGLGLAIARAIVEAHNGTIRIKDGDGGTIEFVLPISDSNAVPESTTSGRER